MLTVNEIKMIVEEACEAAKIAATDYYDDVLGGVNRYACGFAWVNIYEYQGKKIKGNMKIGRAMKAAGIEQDYTRAFQIWNPAKFPCQNIDTLEKGAAAAAEVLRRYGFTAYARSRLD